MQLLEHFKALTLHPKNAQELKGLIVRLALRGKLTDSWRTKNLNVKNATELVDDIQDSKIELIEKRKMRPNKSRPIKATLEMKYKIPSTWEWYNLSDVVFFQEGPGIRKWQFRETGVKLLNVQNIVGDTLVLNNTDKHVETAEFLEKYQHFKVEEGDLLFASSGGSWGKSAWFIDPGYDVMLNTSMIRLCFYDKNWYPDYLKTFISSEFFKDQMKLQLVGIQPNFGSTHLNRVYIPIPPLEEQKAIVEVVNTLFKEVEQLEQLTQARVQLKTDFVTSALQALTQAAEKDTATQWAFLQEHFSAFFTEKANIKKLRESILQLAVQGKLTRDWRAQQKSEGIEVEAASVLLERIKAEKAQLVKDKKIKKEKPLPAISEEEIPYDLPEGWVWCRMQEVGLFERGKSKHRPRNDFRLFSEGTYPLVQTGDVSGAKKTGGIITTNKSAYNDFGLAQSRIWSKGTLCITIAANIAETGFLGFDACFPDSVVGFSSMFDDSLSQYVEYFITVMKSDLEKYAPSTAQKNINLGILFELKFPLPPISEQQAIVSKVNSLMALCDSLEAEIDRQQTTQEQWMQSCLREVFEGEGIC